MIGKNIGRRIAYLGAGAHATTTGTTLSSTPVFDLTGYTGALAFVTVQVTSTANGLAALVCTASGGTFNDVAGSFTTAHTSALMLEIWKPSGGPFVKFQLRQGTSGQHSPILVWGTGPESVPTSNTSCTYKFVNCPVTGTATSS